MTIFRIKNFHVVWKTSSFTKLSLGSMPDMQTSSSSRRQRRHQNIRKHALHATRHIPRANPKGSWIAARSSTGLCLWLFPLREQCRWPHNSHWPTIVVAIRRFMRLDRKSNRRSRRLFTQIGRRRAHPWQWCDDSGRRRSTDDNSDETMFRKWFKKRYNCNAITLVSENDESKCCSDFSPSRHTLPFLPKSSKCLKVGHLAKVIAKNGRVVIGRVRYIGPLVSTQSLTVASGGTAAATADADSETYVGLQLPNKIGECDGSFEGRRIFDWCDYVSKFIFYLPSVSSYFSIKKLFMHLQWTATWDFRSV